MTDLKIAREGFAYTRDWSKCFSSSHWLTVSLCEPAVLEMLLKYCHASYLRISSFFYYFQIFHYLKLDLSYQNSSDEDINLTARDDDPTDARPSRKMEIEDENVVDENSNERHCW